MMTAWIVEITIPLMALPTTTENLDMGATRISFINPNSLSQMIEMEEKIELKRIVIQRMPGKINCIYVTPPAAGTSRDIPPPTRKSQTRGLAIVEMRRLLSRTNFLNSRATIT
jgi:hypothetical protein